MSGIIVDEVGFRSKLECVANIFGHAIEPRESKSTMGLCSLVLTTWYGLFGLICGHAGIFIVWDSIQEDKKSGTAYTDPGVLNFKKRPKNKVGIFLLLAPVPLVFLCGPLSR